MFARFPCPVSQVDDRHLPADPLDVLVMFTFLQDQASFHQCGTSWFEPSGVAGTSPTFADAAAGINYMQMQPVDASTCQHLISPSAQTIRFHHHGGLTVTITFRIISSASTQPLVHLLDATEAYTVRIIYRRECTCTVLALKMEGTFYVAQANTGSTPTNVFVTQTFRVIPAQFVLDIWSGGSLITSTGASQISEVRSSANLGWNPPASVHFSTPSFT